MNDITSTSSSIPANPDVVVIGGGLAGLTAAAVVAKAGKSVVVREKRGVLGGDARSTVSQGFTFNQGPHALYRGGPAETTLRELGVNIRGGKPPKRGRLVFGGQAHIAPAGAPTLLRTTGLRGTAKLEIAKTLGILPRLKPEKFAGLTVNEWVANTVRSERPAEMIRCLVRLTTYSNDPDLMSADVAISQVQGGLGPGVLYLDGGWQTLVDQLAATRGVHIATGEAVTELPDAPAVIIAAGGPKTAASLLDRTYKVGPPAEVSCLDLGLERAPDHDFVLGGDEPFYFSNHSAVAKMAPDGLFHAGAVQYLAQGDEPDAEAIGEFCRYGGVRDADIMTFRKLHRMTAATAVPLASQGGLAGRPKVDDTGQPNVFLAGDWVGPVGHLADAVVASAKAAAEKAVARLGARVG